MKIYRFLLGVLLNLLKGISESASRLWSAFFLYVTLLEIISGYAPGPFVYILLES